MKPLTKEWARAFLPAVDELIKHYEGKITLKSGGLCPLCSGGKRSISGCVDCPWMVFEKTICDAATRREGRHMSDLRDERPPWWCARSLKRLARWRRRLVKIIEAKPRKGAR